MDALLRLYKEYCGHQPAQCEPIKGSGSNRQYYRLSDAEGHSLIGVVGTSRDENHAFIYLARHFTTRQLPVPEVLSVSDDGLCYLQTDLGSTTLFDALKKGREAGGRYTQSERELLRRTIAQLPNVQIRGARGLDFSQCYPQAEMDRTSVIFDLNYFKYCFLKATGLDFHELKLEASFQLMAKDLTEGGGDAFLYRDFQARNVMLDEDGQPWFIDFQGGRRGPVQYDVASFLWQASAQYSPELRNELIDVYIQSLKQYTEVNEVRFREKLRLFVLFRLLQVLGAYGFRGYFERKRHFLESIPPAMQNLRDLLAEGGCPYPYLNQVLTELVQLPQFAPQPQTPVTRADGFKTTDNNPYKPHPADGPATFSKYDGKGPLRVRVFSFSYRKGIPSDESGNGGGYVFDCRSTHNPGRYEPYKQLTGLDEPVIRFLEDDGEILTFLESVYRLADAHVERYLQRGFTDLMFAFGCTGGQHRSVYSAQHLAEHLNEKYGIEVDILHREQDIRQTLPARPFSLEA
ncbi:MAG: phosphotransferase [Bacteroidaceae bacterium]|nr:phosphotransferase [Bacteroidaceae bacterium]